MRPLVVAQEERADLEGPGQVLLDQRSRLGRQQQQPQDWQQQQLQGKQQKGRQKKLVLQQQQQLIRQRMTDVGFLSTLPVTFGDICCHLGTFRT